MVNDRVGDFIIRLQNAAMIGKEEVRLPHSIFLTTIAKKLKELGYLRKVEVEGDIKKTLVVELAYDAHGVSKLRGVKRISSPGRRLYGSHTLAHRVKGGTGARIISSSIGIISDAEARKNRVGGEDLFEIW
jgi:small subunit ribosomal protein S8